MNLDFDYLKEYKQVDKICCDMYGTANGVSHYIEDMELNENAGKRNVSNWLTYYKQLKHLRWVRNKIAHETDGGPYATDLDMQNLKQFHTDLIKQRDPLALIENTKNNEIAHNDANPISSELGWLIISIIVIVFLSLYIYFKLHN